MPKWATELIRIGDLISGEPRPGEFPFRDGRLRIEKWDVHWMAGNPDLIVTLMRSEDGSEEAGTIYYVSKPHDSRDDTE